MTLESRLYRVLSAATELCWLSVLWVLTALPALSAPAATAALFRVVGLRADGVTGSTSSHFFAAFTAGFGRVSRIGGAWLLAGAVLVGDLWAFPSLSGAARVPALGLLVSAGVAYAAATPYLLVALGDPTMSATRTVRLAMTAMAGNPGQTVRCLIVEAACVTAVLALWPLVFIVPSLGAIALHALCREPVRNAGAVLAT